MANTKSFSMTDASGFGYIRKPKYRNRKTVVDGESFDSRKEANRYCELQLMRRAGEISELRRQVVFTLIPAQYVAGKCAERPVKYVADFVYVDNSTGRTVVEDVKSDATRTPEYIIKRKLMLYRYEIQIKEV